MLNICKLPGFHTCQVHFIHQHESLIRRLQVASLELMSSNTVVATATGVPGNQVPMAGAKKCEEACPTLVEDHPVGRKWWTYNSQV